MITIEDISYRKERLSREIYGESLAINMQRYLAKLEYNSRSMMHDKDIYPDPFNFKPERFLDEDG